MLKILRYVDWSELSGLLVGAALAVVLCSATLISVLYLQREGIIGKKEYTLYSNIGSAQGLSKGTKVQINGVNVGRVEDISLADGVSISFVKLKLAIDTEYKNWITDKSVLFVTRDQNIISERVINIDISQKGDKVLDDGNYLTSIRAQDIESVLTAATEILDEIRVLVKVADTLLGKLGDTNSTIGALLNSRALYDNLGSTVVEVNNLLGDATDLMTNVGYMFDKMNDAMPKAMAFADTLSSGVMGLMENLDNLTGRANTLINSLDTTMGRVGGMVENLNSVVGATGNIISEGSQVINKTDGFVDGVSRIWFVRNKIPRKDTIPLLEDAW
ncbi:MAG: MlaD family protein [Fibromonadaceae bacterium]|jgi:phospholipid/cholesterol/gamma-HCH transport system substrate-binding protein|nr:MlaD family protein [Fibromonadaceae bacterium]